MRASGILLPVASLPSRYGIGCFSKEAYEFVDFLPVLVIRLISPFPHLPGIRIL